MSGILVITIFLAGLTLIIGGEWKTVIALLALSLLSATCIPKLNPWYFDIVSNFNLFREAVITTQLLIVAALLRHYTH